MQNPHFPAREVNTLSDIEPLIDLLADIPETNRVALVTALKAYWKTSCPRSVADAVQGLLDAMMENSAKVEVIPSSSLGKLEQVYHTFTGHDSFFKRIVNSHDNDTYITWMYDRYPNADSVDYFNN